MAKLKLAFFRKCDLFFKSPKQMFQITILCVSITIYNLIKFQAQDIDLEDFLEDLKNE